ncbi:MAG: hypothetical protein [Hatfieldvirus porci]|uniref:Uncharacterized protein n=1 Tax=phage Lak_Megaphage_RVC_JS4_GC31 TaxID=3109228 RepID=A0ABZ0Z0X8_9CAUD|nr:MAG: hypothetical protein [phage Lak_Megaphage_RVC_AP3_GC31]WQJ52848.1 MAG: hypothetical protein [phage Lak_Megaphage_RVC_JS4_GC31]
MITKFSKVNGNIKLNTNSNVNNHNWLSFILPILGQVWSDEAFVFMHKHAGLKLGFGIQGTEIRPSVLVYSSDKNERVRIFMKVNGLVEEVFVEDGDIMFDDPHEAIKYVEHVEVLDAVAEIADVVLSTLLDTVKEKNETNDAASSAKAIVEDLIKKFGFDSDAIYRRNGKRYITHAGSILCVKNVIVAWNEPMNDVYVGRIDQMPDGFMQALRTAENIVKTYNL